MNYQKIVEKAFNDGANARNNAKSHMSMFSLEKDATEYAQSLVDLFNLPDGSNDFTLTKEAKEKLDYILGHSINRLFPDVKPTLEWAGAVLDFLEIVKLK